MTRPGGFPERPGFERVCYDGKPAVDVNPSSADVLLCCPPDEISELEFHKLAALQLLGLIFAFDVEICVADQLAPRSTAFSLTAFVHIQDMSRMKLSNSQRVALPPFRQPPKVPTTPWHAKM